MLGRSAKNSMRKYIIYLMSVFGLILVTRMSSSLERRCDSAEEARDLYSPIISDYILSQSGASNAPRMPELDMETRIKISTVNNKTTDSKLTTNTTVWLLYAGILLITSALTWHACANKPKQKNATKK